MFRIVPPRRRKERGEGQTQLWVTLGIIAVVAFVCWKVVPVWYGTAEFKAGLDELARTAAVRAEKDDKIIERFTKLCDETKIPSEKRTFTIKRTTTSLTLTCEYHILLEFPGYTYDWTETLTVTGDGGKYN